VNKNYGKIMNPVFCMLLSIPLFYFKGFELYLSGQFKEAIKVYDKVIEIKPDSQYAWVCKGIAFEKFGRHKEAEQAFAKAKQL
jgi:Flp pilus assembly protein TadD